MKKQNIFITLLVFIVIIFAVVLIVKKPQGTPDDIVQPLEFPYQIPNSELVIQRIDGYSGTFLEDGSDVAVKNVATIVLENTGTMYAEYIKIKLGNEKRELCFDVSVLGPGETVIVQEESKAIYQEEQYAVCDADIAYMNQMEISSDKIGLVENSDNSIALTNLTDETIPCVRVFYKYYVEEEESYMGGITYTAKVTGLEAHSTQTIYPSHYAMSNSKVVMIRTYDTEN